MSQSIDFLKDYGVDIAAVIVSVMGFIISLLNRKDRSKEKIAQKHRETMNILANVKSENESILEQYQSINRLYNSDIELYNKIFSKHKDDTESLQEKYKIVTEIKTSIDSTIELIEGAQKFIENLYNEIMDSTKLKTPADYEKFSERVELSVKSVPSLKKNLEKISEFSSISHTELLKIAIELDILDKLRHGDQSSEYIPA
jgi:hypothetical protein